MTYYEDVRVPADLLVGELHGGWKLITLQLNHERIGLAAFGAAAMQRFDEVLAWARATPDEAGAKVYSSETVIEVVRLLLDVVGEAGLLRADSPGAALRGELEIDWRACQIQTFGGGVNEIQREIVAMLALGMPRAPR